MKLVRYFVIYTSICRSSAGCWPWPYFNQMPFQLRNIPYWFLINMFLCFGFSQMMMLLFAISCCRNERLTWCAELHCCGVLSYTAVVCWATLLWCVELHCCGVLSYTAVACWATLLWCVELHCCGLKDYMDWERNIYFNCSSPGVEKCGVPFSCCQPDPNVSWFLIQVMFYCFCYWDRQCTV